MTTFSTNCPVFEPRFTSQKTFSYDSQQAMHHQFPAQNSFSPSAQPVQMQPSGGFSDSVQHMPLPSFRPQLAKAQSFQPGAAFNSHYSMQAPSFAPKIQVPVPDSMPEFKMNFKASQRRSNFGSQQTFDSPPVDDLKRQSFIPTMCKTLSHSVSMMGFGGSASPMKAGGNQQAFFDGTSSPRTMSTICSSQGSNSLYTSEDESNFNEDFDSSAMHPLMRTKSFRSIKTSSQNQWKKKVKTELCKFWLQGLACENLKKEQGCGFAHGQDELQKKKGLSRQYLTSVCKNFLEHPSKCTYGQRCIFQHPTYDVKTRQTYTKMMQDNTRYTAMRLFQDIEGSDTVYINTYAATTPRLQAFRNICSSAKDNGQDYVDEEQEQEQQYEEEDFDDSTVLASEVISRDFFRSNTK